MVDCAVLERLCTAMYPGFESRSLRHRNLEHLRLGVLFCLYKNEPGYPFVVARMFATIDASLNANPGLCAKNKHFPSGSVFVLQKTGVCFCIQDCISSYIRDPSTMLPPEKYCCATLTNRIRWTFEIRDISSNEIYSRTLI